MFKSALFVVSLLSVPVSTIAVSGDSGPLKGVVVTSECAAPISHVRVSASFKGKIRSNVTKTDATGYFEIDLKRLYPDVQADAPVTVSFEKKGYITKHKNVQLSAAKSEEIPLTIEPRADAEKNRYSGFSSHRKNDCNSWTVFAVPHKADKDVTFPDYDQVQEMHFRLSTHFQQLDLPLENVPGVSLEWLEQARNLALSGNDAEEFGSYLNALGVLYGNVSQAKPSNPGGAAQVSSYMQIISSFNTKIGQTKVAHRVPLNRLDEEIYNEDSEYISSLTSTTLLAVVSRELDRVTGLPGRPDYHSRLQRIRNFIIAERKNIPKQERQTRSERSTFHVLNQLAEVVDKAMIEGNSAARGREILANALE